LRERAEDIPPLVDHLVAALATRLRMAPPRVTPEALHRLVTAPWPGNVRQLENALERALLLCDGVALRVEDLPSDLAGRGALGEVSPREDELSIPRRTAALERSLIADALARTSGNKSAAARLLELSYKALLYQIRDYGLDG
jgi:DNA-binding NtrC family response regulator